MADTKHSAEVLADSIAVPSPFWEDLEAAADMLRRIPMLEADMRRATQALAWGAERLPEMEVAYQKASAAITAFETKRIDNEDK